MIKRFYIITPLIAMLFIAFSCGSSTAQDGAKGKSGAIAKDLNVAQFEKQMKDKPGIILDVRTPDEYRQGHIDGSLLIDWYSKDFDTKVAELDKSKPIYVYCHVGGRSASAMKKLTKQLGFTEVYNLKGGIVAWRNVH